MSVRKQGDSGTRWSHNSASSPGGAERAPKWTKVGDQLRCDSCLEEKGRAEEAAGGDCCKQLFLIHISLHNQIMRPTTFSIIHR